MKVTIEGTEKEIADLVLALQGQRTNELITQAISLDAAELADAINRKIQQVSEEGLS